MSKEIVQLSDSSAMTIKEAVDRYNILVEFTKGVMRDGVDYGVIPGTGKKAVLLKPGAEKLTTLFKLSPSFVPLQTVTDFDKGFFYFQYRCELHDQAGNLVGSGVGSCNSKEKKYRYRNIYENKATEAEKAAAIRVDEKTGKYGPYKVYVIENAEPFDQVNTFDKMAQKRALVAATLIAANASEFFTQDLEDLHTVEGEFRVIDTEKKPAKVVAPTEEDMSNMKKNKVREVDLSKVQSVSEIAPSASVQRSWPGDLVHRAVAELGDLYNHPKHIVGALNQSPFVDDPDFSYDEAIDWLRERKE